MGHRVHWNWNSCNHHLSEEYSNPINVTYKEGFAQTCWDKLSFMETANAQWLVIFFFFLWGLGEGREIHS